MWGGGGGNSIKECGYLCKDVHTYVEREENYVIAWICYMKAW